MSRTTNGFYTPYIKNRDGSPYYSTTGMDGSSPIDTAIMVSGVLFAAEYFKNDGNGIFYNKAMGIAAAVEWSDAIIPNDKKGCMY